jgi:hypothetical protein
VYSSDSITLSRDIKHLAVVLPAEDLEILDRALAELERLKAGTPGGSRLAYATLLLYRRAQQELVEVGR